MKKIFILLLLSVSIFAASDKDKTDDIRKLLVLTGSGDVGIQVLDQMMGSFKQMLPDIPEKFWTDVKKSVSADELINLVVPIYDKHFTHEDIKALIDFYNTPVGKKFTKALPQVTQESMTVGQEWGRQLGERIGNKLKEEGYQ